MVEASEGEIQSLNQIALYHRDVIDSLNYFLRNLYHKQDSRLLGYNIAQFNELLSTRLAETDLRSSLAIFTVIEAALNIDFLTREESELDDSLSQAFGTLRKNAKRVRLDDILELWKNQHPELGRLVSQLRAAFHFRNWLAHGRYGQKPNNGRFDYLSLYLLAQETLANFPLVPK